MFALLISLPVFGQKEKYFFNTITDTYNSRETKEETELIIDYDNMTILLLFLEDSYLAGKQSPKKIVCIKKPNPFLTIFTEDWGWLGLDESTLYKSPDTGEVKLTCGSKIFTYKKYN